MSYRHRIYALFLAAVLMVPSAAGCLAETKPEDAEQGVEEIQPLLEIADVEGEDGMSLEEMTDAFAESAMCDYHDSATGFSMQYPAVFQFDEEQPGNTAATADGKATLQIDNMANQGEFTEETLREAILFETPDAEISKNEKNGCLRTDRITARGATGQTDLYLLTKSSFHHIVIRYPAEEKGTYFTYIEYMINTMETNETDLG